MDTIKVQDLAHTDTRSSCMLQLTLIILFQKSLLLQALLSVEPQPRSLVSTISFFCSRSEQLILPLEQH